MCKILYLSCHSILEFDEVSLFHELGHEVFSPGAYVEPDNPGDRSLRPGIPGLVYNQEIAERFNKLGQKHPGIDAKEYLTSDIVDYFDTVIVMHMPKWITNNWPVIKNKRVIWRTIGQSIHGVEDTIQPYRKQGLEIVRYSPTERNIPGYLGENALIRFYKDPEDYKDWVGAKKRVINFSQHMKKRDRACSFTFFESVTRPFDRHLFGPGNNNVGAWGSDKIPYEQLVQELRENRVYFYTGTHPASYTLNFIEAWMTGIPIVAIGARRGNAWYFPGHNLYEIPGLIDHGATGFHSDNPKELQAVIKELLNNDEMAQSISGQARDAAIEYFGKEKIKQQWKEYLG